MNESERDAAVLAEIRAAVDSLPPVERDKCIDLAAEIRGTVADAGEIGSLALALVGAEMALGD